MTSAEVASRKLAVLVEFSRRARRRRPDTAQSLAEDAERLDALSMALLVAIQEAIDIAFHIVSDQRWGTPGSYAEGFQMLADNGAISAELASAMIRATGLRNRLAHGYASVDAERLWAELPTGLDTLDAYARAMGAFVSR